MASLPPETILSADAVTHPGGAAPTALEAAWIDLHRQAGDLARLAQIAAEPAKISAAPCGLIAKARPWQTNLFEQGIEDVAAMLGSGMAALATLSARGQDTAAPALALWREFHAARGALLAVLCTDESN
jgi:phage-related tail protein